MDNPDELRNRLEIRKYMARRLMENPPKERIDYSVSDEEALRYLEMIRERALKRMEEQNQPTPSQLAMWEGQFDGE